MARPIELDGLTFYEPNLRWKAGRAYIRFYSPDMRPKQKDFPLHTSDKAAAQLLFQQRRFEYLNGRLNPWTQRRQQGVTLSEAVAAYLQDQDVRPTSLRSKRVRLEPFARANPGMLVSGVTAEHVRTHCYRPDLKAASQQRYLSEMRQFIAFCQERGWISSNPASEVLRSTPKRKRRPARTVTEYLTPEEVRRIASAIQHDADTIPARAGRRVLVDIIGLAVTTGLRLGELCRLRWADVRLYDPPKPMRGGGLLYGWLSVKNGEHGLTKTGDEDRVPVVPQAYDLLRRLQSERGTSPYVFVAPQGGLLTLWWVSHIFRSYRRQVGIRDEIHFHSLRHTCASWLAEAGVDLKVIQEVLRHSNIRQTMRYAHLIPEAVASRMVSAFSQMALD